MILSGYEIEASCDTPLCGFKGFQSGETWAGCSAALRKRGWYIGRDRGKAFCPFCAEQRRSTQSTKRGDK